MIRTDGYTARTSISLVVAAFAGLLVCVSPLWGFIDKQPISFSYYQKSGPSPGWRKFERKGDKWIETAPDGRTAFFRIVHTTPNVYVGNGDASDPHNVRTGQIIERIKEPGYYFFIPDYHSPGDRELLVHSKTIKGWPVMGRMSNVCGNFESYEKLTCE